MTLKPALLALPLLLASALPAYSQTANPAEPTPPSAITGSETPAPLAEDTTSAPQTEAEFLAWASAFDASLKRQQGDIAIPQAGATLRVPEGYVFLDAADAEKVLVEAWGNPPGQGNLGMLMPANSSPFEASAWAVTVAYEEEGYVSDADAAEIDYSVLLKQMQEDAQASNSQRSEQGYEPINLLGWAEPPRYDANSHKLYWAKELQFGDSAHHTLNYNIRVLGRKGVLVLNFIADMEQKDLINQHLDSVLGMADFNDGSRYVDFNPDIDQVAAYGIGALVAGKVLAKTGFLAVLLLLLKKFGVFILIGLATLGKLLLSKRKSA